MNDFAPPEEMETTAVETIDPRYTECGRCRHYPAYHDQPGKKCRAWTDETSDSKCDCIGWAEPVAKINPQEKAHEHSI